MHSTIHSVYCNDTVRHQMQRFLVFTCAIISSFEQEIHIIGVIDHDKPSSSNVAEPAAHELIQACIMRFAHRDLHTPFTRSNYFPIKACSATCICPKHRCVWRLIPHTVAIFDGKLRFSVKILAAVPIKQLHMVSHHTPPSPVSATRLPGLRASAVTARALRAQ